MSSRRVASCGVAPRRRSACNRRAFTLTELLVAIGIIALLIGILLPALGAILQRAKRTATQGLMEQFAAACNQFQQQLGFLPGLVPEDVLAFDTAQSGGISKISGTENALLHLMGGGVREGDVTPAEWASLVPGKGWVQLSFQRPTGGMLNLKVNINEMTTGRGPVIAGRQYERFLTLKPNELVDVQGQVGTSIDFDPLMAGTQGIPDVVDAWGQPIMYLRGARGDGLLAGSVLGSGSTAPAQFDLYSLTPYTRSTTLGEMARDQDGQSLFNTASMAEGGATSRQAFLAQVIRHAGMGNPENPVTAGVSRGRFVLFSAGKDGIYFDCLDGPGSKGIPVFNIITMHPTNGGNFGPVAAETYNDLRVFGGS